MDVQMREDSPALLLKRIDAIILELQMLRREVLALQEEEDDGPMPDPVETLYGSLGQGTQGEYDQLSEWRRFDE